MLLGLSCSAPPSLEDGKPAARAVRFLAREVSAWPRKNRCYSCHNNGDAARALYAARPHSIVFDPEAIGSTTRWLARPDEWKHSGPPGRQDDRKLSTIQFASALVAARNAGEPAPALERAAELVASEEEEDGSWALETGGFAGSPVSYGRTLGTVAARDVLALAGGGRFAEPLSRADAWLRRQRPVSVFEAGALLIGLAPSEAEARSLSLNVIRKGECPGGGWGPYVTSPPEIFDTAIVLLGLSKEPGSAEVCQMRQRGRGFLIRAQQPDGSWQETTRPSGGESYAQRISTTAWATLALLATS